MRHPFCFIVSFCDKVNDREGLRMRKTFIGAAVIFMCLFMLTGCYFGKNLEERIGARQIEKLEETLKNQSEIQNDFEDLKVEG